MNGNGEVKMNPQMKKKPLSLRLKQRIYYDLYMIHRILCILTFNRKSKLWCKIGLHKDIPTSFQDFKCVRCGKWSE